MKSLQYNDFFVGGLALAAIAVFATVAFKILRRYVSYFSDGCGVGITITSNDRTVSYFYRWLAANDALRHAKYVGINLEYRSSSNEDDEENDDSTDDTKVAAIPKVGITHLKLKGKNVRLEKEQFITAYGGIMETIHLSTCGGKRQFFEDIIEEARIMCETRPVNKVVIYKAINGEWSQICSRGRREIASVVLDEGITDMLLKDMREFIDSKKWYADRGVPHRRGYLLYGPPGCGKTSLIRAMASEMDHAVCILNLKACNMNDEVLSGLMNSVPDKSFVLLEDVDSVFTSREGNNNASCENSANTSCDEPPNRVTFSGLLNATDGIASSEGRILFMTTNHIKKLDPALIRPGRVDRRQLIDYPNKKQVIKLFALFYPEATDAQIEEFGKRFAMEDRKRSVAEIQGHFMLYKNDVKSAIECLFKENGEIIEL